MAKINKKDFYIGTGLYSILQYNKSARLSLIEKEDGSARFTISTNTSNDIGLYMKYVSINRSNTSEYQAWNIPVSTKDKDIMYDILQNNPKGFLVLVLGKKDSVNDVNYGCEILLLSSREFFAESEDHISIAQQKSFTVRLDSHKRSYEVMQHKQTRYKIPTNRIQHDLASIVDCQPKAYNLPTYGGDGYII